MKKIHLCVYKYPKLTKYFYCLPILLFLYIVPVYFAFDLYIIAIYQLLYFQFIFIALLTHNLLASFISLHCVQCFLVICFLFILVLFFLQKGYVIFAEIALKK